jgi:membrane fusion protein, multidrug efflux system
MDTRLMTRVLAAALLAALVGGCGARQQAADAVQDPVMLTVGDLATVGRADVETGVPVQGTLKPLADVNIIVPVADVVEQMLVKEGQAVRRGQVLARMRTTSIAPAAAGAEAQRRVAAADLQRMQNLLQVGAVAERDVESAGAQLKAAEAVAAAANKRLEESTVRAPFSGVIAERLLQAGDRAGEGDRLFRIVNTDELEFTASVTTDVLDRLKPGAPVALTVSGTDGRQVAGRISRVNATVDEATRQVKVYVLVPNRDHRLAGDMFASGRIVLQQASAVLAVPASSVKAGPGGAAIAWVVADGKLSQRTLTVGLRDELQDMVEVKSGLSEGDKVVISPVEGMVDGQPVQLSREAAPGAPASAATAAAETTATAAPSPAASGTAPGTR